MAGSLLATAGLPSFKKPLQSADQLKILATNWGFQGSTDDFCRRVKDEGYDGIEVWAPQKKEDQDKLLSALAKYDLEFGFLSGNGGRSYDEMIQSYKDSLDIALEMKPLFINCHSGRDFYGYDENRAFIEYGQKRMKETGIPVYHETHRAKILYCTTVTDRFINDYPELELTLDISHWCCVHGSMLYDQDEMVNKALQHVSHVHSRVGFEQGPQVPEPRAPEYQSAVERHFFWWDQVVKRKSEAGETLTMTTEFGPRGYMWSLPYTKQPLADQWAINVHMMNMWRERYVS